MIYIETLGQFNIQYEENSLMDFNNYQYKIIKLFKYFITNKGKMILPETIIEDLWEGGDSKDPKSVLRTQISRLRRLMVFEDGSNATCFEIKFSKGHYIFSCKKNCLLDTELFESNLRKGNQLKDTDEEGAMEAYKIAMDSYKGKYLKELQFEEWVIPIRNRYHRQYLQGLVTYIDLLKKNNKYLDIVRLCEKAVLIDDYNEEININFIEALIEIGEKTYAQNHYEYYSSRLYTHLGQKPSNRLKKLYSKIQNSKKGLQKDFDFHRAEQELGYVDKDTGVLVCNFEEFVLIYDLEKRKQARSREVNNYLGVIALEFVGYVSLDRQIWKKSMEDLMDVMVENLWAGDVIAKWNDRQLLSILYDVEPGNLEKIGNRLKEQIRVKTKNNSIRLSIIFKHI